MLIDGLKLPSTAAVEGVLQGPNFAIQAPSPVSEDDVTTKSYVDALAMGLDWKNSVRFATTTLGSGLTVDGSSATEGDRVLVMNGQASAGIYTVTSGAWVRAKDADSSSEVTSGMYCIVEQGVYQGRGYLLVNQGEIVLGTTALNFAQFPAPAAAQPTPYDLAVWKTTVEASEVLAQVQISRQVTMSTASSSASSTAAPTADTVFSVTLDGTPVATCTFASGSKVGVWAQVSGSAALTGVVRIVAPASLNGLAGLSLLLSCTASA